MRVRLLVAAAVLPVLSMGADYPTGRWDGEITVGKLKVPFQLFFEGSAQELTASFVNGPARVSSKPGTFANGALRLSFAPRGGALEATFESDGQLKGTYRTAKGEALAFTAVAYCTCGSEGEAGPDISGDWGLEGGGRLKVERKGDDTWATLAGAGGDVGPLAGRFDGVSFMLHYFDGTKAALLEIQPGKDGKRAELVLQAQGEVERKLKASR